MAVTLTQFNNNLINPSSWTAGSGSVGIFGANGDAAEQNRYVGTDPWGTSALVWQTVPSGNGNADGGWNTSGVAITNTKLYRFSVWVKRTSSTSGGTFYFGLQSDTGTAIHLGSDQGGNSNPYWHYTSTSALTQNQWYLFVGHCFPVNYTGTNMHPESGYYTVTGGRVGSNAGNVPNDVKWASGTTVGVHRTYHYYCGDSTTRLEFFMPRIDCIDGTQPSIRQLLSNSSNPNGIAFNDGTGQASLPAGGALAPSADRGNLIDLQSFSSTNTWYNPGATKVHVKLIGGGGGGAGYAESGGAGCYAEGIYDVTGVNTVAITVGGGGSYTTYYGAAGQGGTSSFGSYLSAIGGYGANQQYGHSGGHGGNSSGGAGFSVQGSAGCGHINSVGHGALGSIGGQGYFGGAQAHARNHGNLGNTALHGIYAGAPGSGGPGNITDWGSAYTNRGHSAGEYGASGLVVVYSYK